MRCTLDELLALPVEYYEALVEIAPKWLGSSDNT